MRVDFCTLTALLLSLEKYPPGQKQYCVECHLECLIRHSVSFWMVVLAKHMVIRESMWKSKISFFYNKDKLLPPS